MNGCLQSEIHIYINLDIEKKIRYVANAEGFFEHKSSPTVFSGVDVSQSLVFSMKWYINHCLSFGPFLFGHSIVRPLTYSFLLPL